MGAHGSNISSGLPPEDVKRLGIVGGYLAAGTEGGGTYRRSLSNITTAVRSDSLNGWQFIGVGSLDTVYTRYSDTASAGGRSQLYGWTTTANFAAARWEQYLDREYSYSESIMNGASHEPNHRY